jgi:hypothetical protein
MAFVIVSVLIIGALIMHANKRIQPGAEQSAISVQDTNVQTTVVAPAEKSATNGVRLEARVSSVQFDNSK